MSTNENLKHSIVWGRKGNQKLTAQRCPVCDGIGRLFANTIHRVDCVRCGGMGWFGIDPRMPVKASPGSDEKVTMLSVRYATGLPLWNDKDSPEPEVSEPLRGPSGEHLADEPRRDWHKR